MIGQLRFLLENDQNGSDDQKATSVYSVNISLVYNMILLLFYAN